MHSLYGIRRKINAADVAAFLLEEKKNEALLLQKRRDAENSAERGSLESKNSNEVLHSIKSPTLSFDEMWEKSTYTFENFGELK